MFEPMPALIRMERERQGLSQDALAKLAGISRSRVVALESGEDNVSLELLLKVANALRITELRIAALNLAAAPPELTVLLAAADAVEASRRVIDQAAASHADLDRVSAGISSLLDRALTPMPDIGIAKAIERLTAGEDRATGRALRELAELGDRPVRTPRRQPVAKENARKRAR